MDSERERNRMRKLNALNGREWDATKQEEDYDPRGGKGQFRRGMHGGVSGHTRRDLMMVVRVKLRRKAMALIMVIVDEDAVEEVDVVGPILVGRGKIRPFLREHLKDLLRRKTRPLPLRLLSTTNPNSQPY